MKPSMVARPVAGEESTDPGTRSASDQAQGPAHPMTRLDNSRHSIHDGPMKQESDLTTLNISLPRRQREFVETQAARSGCTTTSEYVRRLIHDAQKRAEQEDLERKLIEGLESGDPIEITPEYWERKRRELVERHSRKKP